MVSPIATACISFMSVMALTETNGHGNLSAIFHQGASYWRKRAKEILLHGFRNGAPMLVAGYFVEGEMTYG